MRAGTTPFVSPRRPPPAGNVSAMPLRNRVTPIGELVADPARGLVYGNRGCLHDERGRIRRPFASRRWIACRVEFAGRRRAPLMAPGRYTELFFLDEATALAAGHRPCAECRREDYRRLVSRWSELHPGQAGADAIDAQLHRERLVAGSGERAVRECALDELPDGSFVLVDGAPWLVLDGALRRWSPAGYVASRPFGVSGRVQLLTPPSLVKLLRAGWQPQVPLVHPSAFG